jgi:hypothetical protein
VLFRYHPNLGGTSAYYALVQGPTTTGCSLTVQEYQGATRTTSCNVSWLAIGPLV